MAKLETFITISVFDDGSVVIKENKYDGNGNHAGDHEIQASDVAAALNLKTANDGLADYVAEVVGGEGAGDAEPMDTESPKPIASASKPHKRGRGVK